MWNKLKTLFRRPKTTSILDDALLDPVKKTIVVIDDDIPQHDKSSGSKRLFELIKIFKQLDLNILFLPHDGLAIEPYYSDLQQIGVIVLLNSPNKHDVLKKLNSFLPIIDYAWISRPNLNRRFQPKIKKNPKIKIIFDTVDLHYIRMLRQAETENNEKQKRRSFKTKKLELKMAANAHATLTVTKTEKELLEIEKVQNVFVIPNIHELKPQETSNTFNQRNGLVFIGGYKHHPNIDAVKWLINEIMPIVWQTLGDIPVYLLGSYPPEEVTSLANDLVHVPGFLENVDSYFENARLFVAPLRYGAGMKGKIGQSLEHKLPIVTTTIGAEGMDLVDGENILIANDTKAFAEKIIQLYQDPILWERIKNEATKAILQYSSAVVKDNLTVLFSNLQSK